MPAPWPIIMICMPSARIVRRHRGHRNAVSKRSKRSPDGVKRNPGDLAHSSRIPLRCIRATLAVVRGCVGPEIATSGTLICSPIQRSAGVAIECLSRLQLDPCRHDCRHLDHQLASVLLHREIKHCKYELPDQPPVSARIANHRKSTGAPSYVARRTVRIAPLNAHST